MSISSSPSAPNGPLNSTSGRAVSARERRVASPARRDEIELARRHRGRRRRCRSSDSSIDRAPTTRARALNRRPSLSSSRIEPHSRASTRSASPSPSMSANIAADTRPTSASGCAFAESSDERPPLFAKSPDDAARGSARDGAAADEQIEIAVAVVVAERERSGRRLVRNRRGRRRAAAATPRSTTPARANCRRNRLAFPASRRRAAATRASAPARPRTLVRSAGATGPRRPRRRAGRRRCERRERPPLPAPTSRSSSPSRS